MRAVNQREKESLAHMSRAEDQVTTSGQRRDKCLPRISVAVEARSRGKTLPLMWGRRANILGLFLLFISAAVGSPDHRWCGLDLAQQLASADIVAKATVVSRSAVRDGEYLATFRLEQIIQSSEPMTTEESRMRLLRLPLLSPLPGSDCRLAAKVKPETKYLIMVKSQTKKKGDPSWDGGGGHHVISSPPIRGGGGSHHVFSSPPIRSNKKLIQEVKSLLCTHCGSRKRVRRGRLSNFKHSSEDWRREGDEEEDDEDEEENGEEAIVEIGGASLARQYSGEVMRLSCSARGNPPPTLYWTMNGALVENTPYTRIHTKKISKFLTKSVLKLRGPVERSAVHLQCHAFNSHGHTSKVKLKKTTPTPQRTATTTLLTTTTTTTTVAPKGAKRRTNSKLSSLRSLPAQQRSLQDLTGPLYGSACPVPDYCMNGGTCLFYSDIGELICQCARDFHGRRCERKYISEAVHGPKMSDKFPICLQGMTHFPCQ